MVINITDKKILDHSIAYLLYPFVLHIFVYEFHFAILLEFPKGRGLSKWSPEVKKCRMSGISKENIDNLRGLYSIIYYVPSNLPIGQEICLFCNPKS